MHYLVTGGTGFIGRHFIHHLNLTADQVTVLSRKMPAEQGPSRFITDLSEISSDTPIDVIINLAGSPIDRRWTTRVKHDLMESRVKTTQNIIELIKRLDKKPELLLNASAVGYYGAHDQAQLDESSPSKPSFTHTLCDTWERTAQAAEAEGVRLCIMRFGVVLGENGGFLKKVSLPFKLGLGGKLGSGQQGFPWIHIDDVIKGIHFLIENTECRGAYNFVAPEAVTNAELTQAMGEQLKRPTVFQLPSFLIRLLFSEMGESLLLTGNRIHPMRLLEAGYQFQFKALKSALADLL